MTSVFTGFICRFGICASHFQCIVGAQQEILCLTVRTTWLIWRVWPRSLGIVSPCMTATPWSRVNWKICDENSTFGCFDAICTQSVSHDHTMVPFMTFLAVLVSFDWPRLPLQQDGSDSTCGRRVQRSSKQNTRANIGVFCLQIWPSIKSRAINCFNKCIRFLFTLEGMI